MIFLPRIVKSLFFFSRGDCSLKLQGDTPEDLEEPYLRYLAEIEEQVSQYVSPEITPIKDPSSGCTVAGFISGYFSFAMIGMNDDEIETSVKPLKNAFVRTLCVFLGGD